MISIFEKEEITPDDIQSLIDNQIEESIHLDFKQAGSLDKSDGKKKEISKDIAAFANSDGGVIIYGIEEKEHKAAALSFVNGEEYTKEWLEQIINSTICRRIPDILVFPVRFQSDIKQTVYVVKIPRSNEAPHLSKDKMYYKRFNFQSVAMEEYEIRDLYGRKSKSKLTINGYNLEIITSEDSDYDNHTFSFRLVANVVNIGKIMESKYKLNIYIRDLYGATACSSDRSFLYESTRMSNYEAKISTTKSADLYPDEKSDAIKIIISLKKEMAIQVLKDLKISIMLLYPNGEEEIPVDLSQLIEMIENQPEYLL